MEDDIIIEDDLDCLLIEALNKIEPQLKASNTLNQIKPKQQRQTSIYDTFGFSNNTNGNISSNSNTSINSKSKDLKELILRRPSENNILNIQESTGYVHHALDMVAYKSWIYPTNYPLRDYQYNIVQKALFANTLVSLPTGLGKTFVAAVVMYNYFRWFPKGKIIFMAPTKPLVNQQIEACHKITGLLPDVTHELNGSVKVEIRQSIWASKRMFFITPQIIENDLIAGICPCDDIVLVVVDEAHRATGKYSYCEVIKHLVKSNSSVRILALSATPGADIKTVAQVVENLCISRIEIRTEDSMDIISYIHKRKLDLIVLKLSEDIKILSEMYSKIATDYLKRLSYQKVFYDKDPCSVSSFMLMEARKRFRINNRGPHSKSNIQTAMIESAFHISMVLAQAYTLLVHHGIHSFNSNLEKFIDEVESKGGNASKSNRDLLKLPVFTTMMKTLEMIISRNDYSSHPKMDKLTEIISNHFRDHSESSETRVIVFSQYRESVEEIVRNLDKYKPLIRVMSFVGQSSASKGKKGFTQKEQLKVISDFQSGNYNVLVSTSIGEEGLDIGEVDLIVCYDSQSSPIRMLQRIGRTGRKRKGRVVILLTEGKEEESYKRAQHQYKTVQKGITNLQGSKIKMYIPTTDILPCAPRPACIKQDIVIQKEEPENSTIQKSKKLKVFQYGPKEKEEYQRKFHVDASSVPNLSLSKYIYRQSQPIPNIFLERSSRTIGFCSLISEIEKLVHEEETDHNIQCLNIGRRESFLGNPSVLDEKNEVDETIFQTSPVIPHSLPQVFPEPLDFELNYQNDMVFNDEYSPIKESTRFILENSPLSSKETLGEFVDDSKSRLNIIDNCIEIDSESDSIEIIDDDFDYPDIDLAQWDTKTTDNVMNENHKNNFTDIEFKVPKTPLKLEINDNSPNFGNSKSTTVYSGNDIKNGDPIVDSDIDISIFSDSVLMELNLDHITNFAEIKSPVSGKLEEASQTPFCKPIKRKMAVIMSEASSSSLKIQSIKHDFHNSDFDKNERLNIVKTPLLERISRRKNRKRREPLIRGTPCLEKEKRSKNVTRKAKRTVNNSNMFLDLEADMESSECEELMMASNDDLEEELDIDENADLSGFIVDDDDDDEIGSVNMEVYKERFNDSMDKNEIWFKTPRAIEMTQCINEGIDDTPGSLIDFVVEDSSEEIKEEEEEDLLKDLLEWE